MENKTITEWENSDEYKCLQKEVAKLQRHNDQLADATKRLIRIKNYYKQQVYNFVTNDDLYDDQY
jgi:hypothetical protein